MQTARRLYVYLLTGISLGTLVSGLSMLLTVLFQRLGLGPSGGALFGGEEALRQELTLASALTAVSLPVWLIHWFIAERSVRPDRPPAPVERASAVRGLYFALAMGALLLAAAVGLISMLEATILRITGAEGFQYRDIGGGLALGIVAGAAFAYHVAIRNRDWARGPLGGAAAWLPRVYLYLATFAGLMLMLNGVASAAELVGRLVINEPPAFAADPWWSYPLAAASAAIVVGGAMWVGHTWYAERLRADTGHRGATERPAKVRLAYFVLAIAATAVVSIYQVGDGIGNAAAALLGVSDTPAADQTIALVVLPIVTGVVFGAAWWYHVRALIRESAALELPGRVETAHRLETYSVALIGLAFGAIASAMLIGLSIEVVFAGGRSLSGASWQRELAQVAPYAILGWAVWIWRWRAVQRRSAVDPAGEAVSTTRRAAALLVLGVSVLSGIGSLGMILYRLFGSLFGIEQPIDPVVELSGPIGGLLVAVAVGLFHLVVLRRDQPFRAARSVIPEGATPSARVQATLRLSGPASGDLADLVAALRGHLPPGYALDLTEAAPTG